LPFYNGTLANADAPFVCFNPHIAELKSLADEPSVIQGIFFKSKYFADQKKHPFFASAF
jgi:hypothetical protein